LETASQHLRKLEYLDISQAPNLGVGLLLRFLRSRKGGIKEVGVVGCTGLKSDTAKRVQEIVPVVRWRK
jgi:hypothetical protein